MEASKTSPYKSRGGIVRIWRACSYSYHGMAAAFRVEAAFRQLALLALVLIPLAVLLPFDRFEKALLIGSVLLSLIIELLNSAVEAAVDRISYDEHPLAKQAKDMGSAAQMLGLVNIVVVWGLVLVDLYGRA
jgi:diacylglycerol kinase (ATP)